MRFNELFKTLTNGLNVKISKDSLLEHLNKHLARKKLIIRKSEGKQNVTHEYNEDILKIPETSKEKIRELLDDMLKETGQTKIGGTEIRRITRSIENDVDFRLYDFIQTFLIDLQKRVLFRLILKLELENPRQYLEFLIFGNPHYQMFENEIVDKCLSDDKYQDVFFPRIEELVEEMRKRKEGSPDFPKAF